MFRRRDEEEITTTSTAPLAANVQPIQSPKNVTVPADAPVKKDIPTFTPAFAPAKTEITTEPAKDEKPAEPVEAEKAEELKDEKPQIQPQPQDTPMSATSSNDITPKQTTYKLSPSGAFVNQDTPIAPAPAKPSFSANTNQTPRFDNIEAERRLTVGYGISLEGKVSDCDKLIIYGSVTAELNRVKTLHISESGKFTGSATIEHAEISGVFEGEIKVSKNIVINSTGRVSGKITYGSIEIKPGGKFTGEILEDKSMVENSAPALFSSDSAWQKEETELASAVEEAA